MGASLTLLGHSSFLMKTDGGKTIYIDPWLDCPTCPDSFKTPEKADLIFVTHGHFDHTASIAQIHEDLDIGIKAIDLNSGKVIYKKNSSRYFMPASNLKLFTGFAALKFLGPDFVYHTSLQYDHSFLLLQQYHELSE